MNFFFFFKSYLKKKKNLLREKNPTEFHWWKNLWLKILWKNRKLLKKKIPFWKIIKEILFYD